METGPSTTPLRIEPPSRLAQASGVKQEVINSRLHSLLQEVSNLAKEGTEHTNVHGAPTIESITQRNRELEAQVAMHETSAARQGALIGQLQAQLAQALFYLAHVTQNGRDCQQSFAAHQQQGFHQMQYHPQEQQSKLNELMSKDQQSQADVQTLLSTISQSNELLSGLTERCNAERAECPTECIAAMSILQRSLPKRSITTATTIMPSARLQQAVVVQPSAENASRTQPTLARPVYTSMVAPAAAEEGRTASSSAGLQILADTVKATTQSEGCEPPRKMCRVGANESYPSSVCAPMACGRTVYPAQPMGHPHGRAAAPQHVLTLPPRQMAPAATIGEFELEGALASQMGAPRAGANEYDDRAWSRPYVRVGVGASPGFSAAFPLSPSTFVTLLSSPDLRMLMSPDAPNCSTPLLLTTPNMGKIDELAAPDAQQDSFTQFKRRQQSSYWPSDLTV
mmetsp:Transcript_25670/g.63513  ORF Transcript_25670/g.63513 Transcript_25670/m.63513 type:complete len:455 (+) Transcript_25670:30-1394(+)